MDLLDLNLFNSPNGINTSIPEQDTNTPVLDPQLFKDYADASPIDANPQILAAARQGGVLSADQMCAGRRCTY